MSANFEPNQNEYKNLTPFKNWLLLQINTWGLNNFPFVESDFDELTNYGMMQKLMGAVNDVISNENEVEQDMTNLFGAFTELQNYINDYFDNLDVQDEINAKLDSMVEDGSLESLIGAYIQPRINEQNQRITQVENMVESATSGSPLVASSTAGMTDTSRVYVNTSDGKWYYYDGDSWEIGGTYQSTEIADGTVTYNDLESALKTDYESVSTTTTVQATHNSVILANGNYQTGSSSLLGHFEMEVNPFEVYKIRISYNPSNWTDSSVRYMFKYNDDVISYTTKTSTPEYEPDTYMYNEIIEVPYNANTLIINSDGLGNTSKSTINKIIKYKHTNISKEDLDSKLKSFFKDIYTDVTPVLLIDNAYMKANRSLASYTSAKVYALNVTPGEKYKFTLKQVYTNPAVLLSNENATYTTSLNGIDYTLKCTGYDITNSTSSYQFENEELTIPFWCKTLYINVANNDTSFNFKKVTSYQVDIEDTNLTSNPLNNKTLLFAGDSVMAASTAGVKGWIGIMQENNPNTNFYNYGHDGYTIAKAEDEWSSRSIQNVLPTMLSEHPHPDYIVFQGGINDLYGGSHGITLGEILPNYDTTNVDRTSFSGGMEYIIDYLYTNFPKTKIVYIVSHQIYSNYFVPYMERAIAICKKWSVPIINLMEDSNINYKITYIRNNYSLNSDGTHPNLDGYEIETPLIENALKYRI